MNASSLLAIRALILSVLSVFIVSCASSNVAGLLSREGAKFNKDLSAAITNADSVVVKEHSFWQDFKGTRVDVSKAPTYVYGSKTLSSQDAMNFASAVSKLSGAKMKYNHEGCLFAPHYTIHFYKNKKSVSNLKVCFECKDVEWKNGSQHMHSKDLMKVLDATVRKAGFNPSSDWKKKASDRYESDELKRLEKEKEYAKPPVAETPYGKPVPGRPGFLFNPFTQNQVDVEGIPSGTKIRDPQDPKARVFRVP